MAEGDGSAEWVHAFVFRHLQPEFMHEHQALDGEGFIDLDQTHIVHGEAGPGKQSAGRRHRAVTHDFGLHARVSVPDQTHLGDQTQFARPLLTHQQEAAGAVVQPRGVARSHPALSAKGGFEGPQTFHGGFRARLLVAVGDHPAVPAIDRHGNDHLLNHPIRPGPGCLLLRLHGVGIGELFGDLRKQIVEILGRPAHRQCILRSDPFRQKAGVGIGRGPDGMVAHVLHAPGDGNLAGTQGNLGRRCGHRRQASGTHSINGKAAAAFRQSRQQRGGAPECQPLVTLLGGGTPDIFFHHLRLHLGIAAQQFTDDLHHHVVRPRQPEETLLPGPPERRSHSIYHDHIPDLHANSCMALGCWLQLLAPGCWLLVESTSPLTLHFSPYHPPATPERSHAREAPGLTCRYS